MLRRNLRNLNRFSSRDYASSPTRQSILNIEGNEEGRLSGNDMDGPTPLWKDDRPWIRLPAWIVYIACWVTPRAVLSLVMPGISLCQPYSQYILATLSVAWMFIVLPVLIFNLCDWGEPFISLIIAVDYQACGSSNSILRIQ